MDTNSAQSTIAAIEELLLRMIEERHPKYISEYMHLLRTNFAPDIASNLLAQMAAARLETFGWSVSLPRDIKDTTEEVNKALREVWPRAAVALRIESLKKFFCDGLAGEILQEEAAQRT